MSSSLVLASACLIFGGGDIDRGRFTSLVEGSWADVKDVEFVYEGSIRHPGRMDRDAKEPDPSERSYQGTFAYRRDDAVHHDLYIMSSDPREPLIHAGCCLLNGLIQRWGHAPDRGPSPSPIKPSVSRGFLVSLEEPQSFLRIFLLPKLVNLLRDDPTFYHYQDLGWEDVGGRRCLKVQVAYPKASNPFSIKHFWLDMERGGNPLRYEYYSDGNLWMRVIDIDLAEFPTREGRTVWLPVRGKLQSFVELASKHEHSFEFTSTPVFEETYAVVRGTVRVNRGLPDRRFTPEWEAKPVTEGLKEIKRRYDQIPPYRKDLIGVEERLQKVIAEADAQATHLEASAPSRASWLRRLALPLGFVGVGLACVALAVYWRWSGR